MNLAQHVAIALMASLTFIASVVLSMETKKWGRSLLPLIMIAVAAIIAGVDLGVAAPQEALTTVGTVYIPLNTTITNTVVTNGTTTTTVETVTATLVTATWTYDVTGMRICSFLFTTVILLAALSAVLVIMIRFYDSLRNMVEGALK